MTVLIPESCWMAWIPQPTTRARSRWRVVSMVSSLRRAPRRGGGSKEEEKRGKEWKK